MSSPSKPPIPYGAPPLSRFAVAARLMMDPPDTRRTALEIQNAVAELQRGSFVLKFGRSGKPQKRFVRVNEDGDALYWISRKKKLSDSTIHFADVERIQRGQHTYSFAKHVKSYGHTEALERSLSIVVANGRSLDLLFDSAQERDIWADALAALLLRQRMTVEDSDLRYLRHAFKAEDTMNTGRLGYKQVKNILRRLNIYTNKAGLKSILERFAMASSSSTSDHGNGISVAASLLPASSTTSVPAAPPSNWLQTLSLSLEDFLSVIDLLRDRPDVASIYREAIQAHQNNQRHALASASTTIDGAAGPTPHATTAPTTMMMSSAAFLHFLRFTQCEAGMDSEDASRLCAHFYPVGEGKCISLPAFTAYLTSPANSAFAPEIASQFQPMDRPLSHYFIESSHNTYLEGDQLKSASSVNMYLSTVQRGCRCVELDCWDGPPMTAPSSSSSSSSSADAGMSSSLPPFSNPSVDSSTGEPVIYHGRTLTSRILFADVCSALAQYGFMTSSFPLILSLEIHCSHAQQVRMAQILDSAFGAALYRPDVAKRRLLMKTLSSSSSAVGGIGASADDSNSALAAELAALLPDFTSLPSPLELLGKVVVKAKIKKPSKGKDKTLTMTAASNTATIISEEPSSSGANNTVGGGGPSVGAAVGSAAGVGTSSASLRTRSRANSLSFFSSSSAVTPSPSGGGAGLGGDGSDEGLLPSAAIERSVSISQRPFLSSELVPALADLAFLNTVKFPLLDAGSAANANANANANAGASADGAGASANPGAVGSAASLFSPPSFTGSGSHASGASLRQPSMRGPGFILPAPSFRSAAAAAIVVDKDALPSLQHVIAAYRNLPVPRLLTASASAAAAAAAAAAATASASGGNTASGLAAAGGTSVGVALVPFSPSASASSSSLAANAGTTTTMTGFPAPSWQMSSIKEHPATKLITKYPGAIAAYCTRQLLRVYPGPLRVDSSNFNPAPFWAAGIQMVALNYQTCDIGLRINKAFFRMNGRCGYVLKPKHLRLLPASSSSSSSSLLFGGRSAAPPSTSSAAATTPAAIPSLTTVRAQHPLHRVRSVEQQLQVLDHKAKADSTAVKSAEEGNGSSPLLDLPSAAALSSAREEQARVAQAEDEEDTPRPYSSLGVGLGLGLGAEADGDEGAAADDEGGEHSPVRGGANTREDDTPREGSPVTDGAGLGIEDETRHELSEGGTSISKRPEPLLPFPGSFSFPRPVVSAMAVAAATSSPANGVHKTKELSELRPEDVDGSGTEVATGAEDGGVGGGGGGGGSGSASPLLTRRSAVNASASASASASGYGTAGSLSGSEVPHAGIHEHGRKETGPRRQTTATTTVVPTAVPRPSSSPMHLMTAAHRWAKATSAPAASVSPHSRRPGSASLLRAPQPSPLLVPLSLTAGDEDDDKQQSELGPRVVVASPSDGSSPATDAVKAVPSFAPLASSRQLLKAGFEAAPSFVFTVTVMGAQHLPKRGTGASSSTATVGGAGAGAEASALTSIIGGGGTSIVASSFSSIPSPYCSVVIFGDPSDACKHRTSVVHENGFNPTWSESFTFRLRCPLTAVLYIAVHDQHQEGFLSGVMMPGGGSVETAAGRMSSSFLAYCAVPVAAIRTGYRSCPLRTAFGKKYPFCSLLLKFARE